MRNQSYTYLDRTTSAAKARLRVPHAANAPLGSKKHFRRLRRPLAERKSETPVPHGSPLSIDTAERRAAPSPDILEPGAGGHEACLCGGQGAKPSARVSHRGSEAGTLRTTGEEPGPVAPQRFPGRCDQRQGRSLRARHGHARPILGCARTQVVIPEPAVWQDHGHARRISGTWPRG